MGIERKGAYARNLDKTKQEKKLKGETQCRKAVRNVWSNVEKNTYAEQ
jgi:hypothetical protein